MAARETGEIRGFVQQMEKAIKRIGAPPVRKKAEFFAFQEAQFKNIVALEQEFRERVTTGPEELGRRVYEAFIAYAKTLSSIMSARSYFRERQTAFADTLGQAIQDGDWAYLATYRINFRFVGWAVKTGLLDEPVFQKLARTILRQRDEMIVLLMPLGINRARMFRGKTPPSHLDLLDQVQGAFEGLITGVDKYIEEIFTTRYRGVAVGRMTGELIEMYSLARHTVISTCDGQQKQIEDFRPGDRVWGVDDQGETIETDVVALHDHGMVEGFETTFDDGYVTTCSAKHKFLTHEGMVSLENIVARGLEVLCERSAVSGGRVANPLWSGLHEAQGDGVASEGVYLVPGSAPGHASARSSLGPCEEHLLDRVGQPVWAALPQAEGALDPSSGMRDVPGVHLEGSGREDLSMAGGEPRETAGESTCSLGRLHPLESGASGGGAGTPGACLRGSAAMASGASRGERGDRSADAHLSTTEDLSAGGRGTGDRPRSLDLSQDPVPGEDQGRGLRLSRSQDLDRGRRLLAFFGSSGHAEGQRATGRPSGAGCSAERGGDASSRRHARPHLGEMLLPTFDRGDASTGMDPVAYKHAPLTCTGSLVLRRVVRVRAVGLCRMYDLEVAHPKHNFLLPNGIVTSNSETLLHFYPLDKKILYRANKIHGRMVRSGGTDFDALADELNRDAVQKALESEVPHPPDFATSGPEVAELMAAASHVSADAVLGGARRIVHRMTAPEDQAPDVLAERREGMAAARLASRKLSLMQRKLLVLRGMLPVEEVVA